MRTRRSPRNQEILWRALGGPKPTKALPSDPIALATKALASPFTSPRMRRMYERDLAKIAARRAATARVHASNKDEANV